MHACHEWRVDDRTIAQSNKRLARMVRGECDTMSMEIKNFKAEDGGGECKWSVKLMSLQPFFHQSLAEKSTGTS
jgi:hypothetical protein